MKTYRAILVGAVLALTGCSDPVVTIENRSAVTLNNVRVSGSGFSNQLGNLPPGASRSLTIHPIGESGVRLRSDAGGRLVDSGEGHGYCEPGNGYRVKMTVETDLSVSIAVDF